MDVIFQLIFSSPILTTVFSCLVIFIVLVLLGSFVIAVLQQGRGGSAFGMTINEKSNNLSDNEKQEKGKNTKDIEVLKEQKETNEKIKSLPQGDIYPMKKSSSITARYNIVIIGKAGVGKSELVNYLFGEQLIDAKPGPPITKMGFHPYNLEVNGIPITLYDTAGVQLDNSNDWLDELREEVYRKTSDEKSEIEDWYHTLFYCINSSGSRIEPFETALIQKFLADNYRVVIIFTKADLASVSHINILSETVRKHTGKSDLPCISVGSKSTDLPTGKTNEFGKEEVNQEIYQGFWESISQRLPDKCIKDINKIVSEWYDEQVKYINNNVGVFTVNSSFGIISNRAEIFLSKINEDANQIIHDNVESTAKKFGQFHRLLNIDKSSRITLNIRSNMSPLSVFVEVGLPVTIVSVITLGVALFTDGPKEIAISTIKGKVSSFTDQIYSNIKEKTPQIKQKIKDALENP